MSKRKNGGKPKQEQRPTLKTYLELATVILAFLTALIALVKEILW